MTNTEPSSMSELTSLKQWVCWKAGRVKANGRFDKIPCVPDYFSYSINAQDPSKHLSYKRAAWAYKTYEGIDGIGFVPMKDDPFCFLDMDNILLPNIDEVKPWVKKLDEKLDSFTYATPSGEGLRVVLKGELPSGGGRYLYRDEDGNHALEAYDSNHFLTFTECTIRDSPIRDAQELLNGLTKVSATSPRKGHKEQDFPEVTLDGDLEVIRREVKETLVSHELSPEPIAEGFRKSTLISIGGHLLMDGESKEWWWKFLHKINVTLLYDKEGNLDGLPEKELREIYKENLKLQPKVSSVEVQRSLDLVSEFLSLIRPRMRRPYVTDWNFLKALETQGRKYGSVVSEDEVRIDGSWLTLQRLSRIATPKTFDKKISRLKEGKIITNNKDKGDKSGHFILNTKNLLSGEYFGLSESGIERMREDSNVKGVIRGTYYDHYLTILGHPFWARQYGNARGPLFAALSSLDGGGRTGRIARIMGRVDENGKPKCGSISGLLRECEKEGTLQNPRRGYWEFSEDFVDKFYKARTDAGEFDRDTTFDEYKRDKREKFREQRDRYLEDMHWQYDLFNEMLSDLEKEDSWSAVMMSIYGTPKSTLVLGKYLVEGRRVTGVIGEQI